MKLLTINFYKILICSYIIISVLCLINQIACFCYYRLGYAQEIEDLFPDEIVYPVYDMETNEVVNRDKVTVWNDIDFVPEDQLHVYVYFNRVAETDGLVDTLVLGCLLIPVLYLYHRINTMPWLACFIWVLNLMFVLLLLKF